MLAVLGIGVAIAHGSSPTGGLSVTPAHIERPAVVGQVGSIVLTNTTGGALKITVTPRPWVQSSSGAVTPDRHADLRKLITVSMRSFPLAPGASQSVTLTLTHAPPGGSLYGSVEAIGVPVDEAKHKGVVVGYRLITNLRLLPSSGATRLKLGVTAPRVQAGTVVLPVRNAGNTLDPISGSAKVSSSLGASTVTIAPQRIVPGATVLMPLTPVKGLPNGRYTVAYTLAQAGHRVAKASGQFRIG
jgi:hypothetical protein